jgi:hypothetical protein
MFDDLTATQEKHPALLRMGRHLSTVCMLSAGDDDWLVTIHRGRVETVRRGPHVMPSYVFRMVAPARDWQDFLQPVPAPGSHDLMALLRRGVLTFEGNLHPLMSHLLYFKLLLATLRRGAAA